MRCLQREATAAATSTTKGTAKPAKAKDEVAVTVAHSGRDKEGIGAIIDITHMAPHMRHRQRRRLYKRRSRISRTRTNCRMKLGW